MNNTPKALRLQIGIFGRTNVGKSSILNLLAGQDVAITSPIAGTTTDVVEKTMELLPLGPVVFLDTGGLDDASVLGKKRLEKTNKVFDRADLILLITEPNIWTEHEQSVLDTARQKKIPIVIIINKIDLAEPTADFSVYSKYLTKISATADNREKQRLSLKQVLIEACPEQFLHQPPLLSDLVPANSTIVFIVPIDLEAPKGRLILPQVQSIRETLDSDATAVVVKEREYRAVLANLKNPPALVVCDSQVVLKMVADTPPDIKCTTFSILFTRNKGDLLAAVEGVKTIGRLKPGDKILIAEACTHHALEDDIARVKIPRWLRQYTGLDLQIDTYSGHDFPAKLTDYTLIIHCGSCMLNRRETLSRYQQAQELKVPITNYGVCIAFLQGVLDRVLEPFPELKK